MKPLVKFQGAISHTHTLPFFVQSNYVKSSLTSVWGIKIPAKDVYAAMQIGHSQSPSLSCKKRRICRLHVKTPKYMKVHN